jgi:hypothetical protein
MGGHEYEYAINILRSAEAAGFEVALAAHQQFRDNSGLPSRCHVYPVFPFTAHTRHCVSLGGRFNFAIGLDGERLATVDDKPLGGSVRQMLRDSMRHLSDFHRLTSARRRIRGFAGACHRLFQQSKLREGDHVFFATLTEFDLLGLASYLACSPPPPRVSWHLQFHFDFLADCGPGDAERKERRATIRRQIAQALDRLSHCEIHCYGTTEELTDQFNCLGVGAFHYLPFPVNPELRPTLRQPGKRLRVTCAGGMRREKGSHEFAEVVETLRADRYFDGRIEMALQGSRGGLRRLRVSPRDSHAVCADVPLCDLGHPLELDSYWDMIRQTDIGLFLYDSRRYRVRCSGILQEMLASGKPVIVPAGCWLAGQIAEPIFAHVETLRRDVAKVGQIRSEDIEWRRTHARDQTVTGRSDRLSFTDSELLATRLTIPAAATEIVLAFQWLESVDGNAHASVRIEQLDGDGKLLGKSDAILGRRRGGKCVLTVVHRRRQAVQLALKFRNAYGNQRLAVSGVQIDFLDAGENPGCPAGSVGLIAASHEQVPELLRDMIGHYAHYRESAEAFSVSWRRAHHPARTIELLTRDPVPSSRMKTDWRVA